MTKEELEKEAEEYAKNLLFVFETDIVQKIVRERVRLALVDVLEQREKRIAELEAQIEKMKCCGNCRHSRTEYEHCMTDKHEKWEIKEND